MAIVNKLISSVGMCPAGATLKTTLKSGTKVTITKLDKSDKVQVVRKRPEQNPITTILKKFKGIYMPVKVTEEYRFGVITIDIKRNGSRTVRLRVCDKNGRASSENNGFQKTVQEENIFPKGKIIRSYSAERKLPAKYRNVALSFLSHMEDLRNNKRFMVPRDNYSFRQDDIYELADLKKCK